MVFRISKIHTNADFTFSNNNILAFVANSLDSFNDILSGKNDNLSNTRVIKVIEANKNEVFKTYVQSYIFATKMHYREV